MKPVSDLARRWQMEALGSDAVEIPNGVDVASFADAQRLDGYPRSGRTVLFLGRYDEPRKGMAVLLGALPALVERFADIEILIVGRGDEDELRDISGRARFLIRKLGSKGWFEKERGTDFREYITVPGCSSRLLELFHALRDVDHVTDQGVMFITGKA